MVQFWGQAQPSKSVPIADNPRHESGGNFGRSSRYGIMDRYVSDMLAEKVRGVSVGDWIEFFKAHAFE